MLHVLVIDRDHAVRSVFSLLLKGAGLRVSAVAAPREARHLFGETDVVVADLADFGPQPRSRFLRELLRHEEVAVVAFAGEPHLRDVPVGSVDTWLAKPVTAEKLVEALREATRARVSRSCIRLTSRATGLSPTKVADAS
ncbi:MAG: hypothetical protein AAGA56_22415 [Myxococcota bacterium]